MNMKLPAAFEPLRNAAVWCVWKDECVKGRSTKVPYRDHTSKAKSNDPSTWQQFDRLPLGNGFAGAGLFLGDGRQGVDLDVCINTDGKLEDWAAELVDRLDSYTEISPSGRGLKIFFYGPEGMSSREVAFGDPVELQPGKIKRREIAYFSGARYFTVTGRPWRDQRLREIDANTIHWICNKVEAVRQAERDRNAAAKQGDITGVFGAPFKAESDGPRDTELEALAPALQVLIRNGVQQPDRSEQFYHAVCWLADSGMGASRIVAMFERYPHGIAAKFADRLKVEVDRCLKKRVAGTQVNPQGKAGGEPDHTKPITATPYVWTVPSAIPPREFLFRRHYIRKFLVATAGPPGGAKSSITLIDYVSMAVGRDLLNDQPLTTGPLRVWLYNTEDPREEVLRRIAAINLYFGISAEDYGGRLFVDTAREQRLVVAVAVNGQAVSVPRVIDELAGEISARQIDVFAADPLIHTHSVPENDNTGMGRVMEAWREVAERGNCCVELTHHIRKNGGMDTTADDMRGAAAILGSVRSLRLTTTMGKEDAKTFGIAEEERRFHVWVNPTGKPSLTPPVSRRDWYRLESVDLGNGNQTYASDSVGVASRWTPPGPFEGITLDECRKCWSEIRRADPLTQARVSRQANGWAGKLVARTLGLDPNAVGVADRVARMLADWERTGTIRRAAIQSPRDGRDVQVFLYRPAEEVRNGVACCIGSTAPAGG